MYHIIPIEEREKPRFEAYAEGILLDARGDLAVNYFTMGESLMSKASRYYSIKTNPDFTEIGKVKDRLVTKVHNTPILVVSEKFKVFLQKNYPSTAEFFSVTFDAINGQPLTAYYICNLIKKYDCTDYENSDLSFTYYDDNNVGQDGIYNVDSLVIDQTKIPNNTPIFLLDNIKSPVIIISDVLKKEMEIANITGFKFVKPEDFMI